jgi:hypothetical protein
LRGIVGFPDILLSRNGSLSFGDDFSLRVRMWTLYWDQFAVPDQEAMVTPSADLDYLESVGVLGRYPAQLGSGEFSFQLLAARQALFEKLETANPGAWATFEDDESSEDFTLEAGRSLRVRLASMLPVPTQDVAFEDILRFRDRRQAEREALMANIDELYLSVANAVDRPLAEHLAVSKLTAGVRDHFEAVRDARFPFHLADLVADYNLAGLAKGAVDSVMLGHSFPQLVGNSVLNGASISIGRLTGWRSSRLRTPYRYLSRIHEEIFSGTD